MADKQYQDGASKEVHSGFPDISASHPTFSLPKGKIEKGLRATRGTNRSWTTEN